MSLRKADLISMFEQGTIGCSAQFKSAILKVTGRGGQSAARDYIHANCILAELEKVGVSPRTLNTKEEALAKLHPATRFRLNMYSPCLAFRYDELKPNEQKMMFDSPDYIFTEKENGVRGILIQYKGKTYLYSRNYSDRDCGLLEYWGNIYQQPTFSPDEIYAIDVEIKFETGNSLRDSLLEYGIQTESKLEAMSALLQMNQADALEIQRKFKEGQGTDLVTFRLIAPLYYKGISFLKRTLGEGHKLAEEVIKYGQAHNLNIKPIRRCIGTRAEKEIFLDTIIAEGGEGIVAHYSKGSYNTSDNRSRNSFIKLKRSVKSTMLKEGIGDTIDGWISGFEMSNVGTANEGLIGSVKVSINLILADGRIVEHVIAQVPNIPLELKKAMTVTDALGNVTLAEEFYGQVLEIDGQSVSAKSRRLTHPRLLRFRYDKLKTDCTYSEEFLASQQDGVSL